MSVLQALELRRRRQEARTAAIARMAEDTAAATTAVAACRASVDALGRSVEDARRSVRRAVYGLGIVAVLVALMLILAARTLGSAAPIVTVIGLPFPLPSPERGSAGSGIHAVAFEPDGGQAFVTADALRLADCDDEAGVIDVAGAAWSDTTASSRPLVLGELLRREHPGLVAVVVEAGHDVRRLPTATRRDGNAALAQQRVTNLQSAVRAVLDAIDPTIPVLGVARGTSGEDLADYCRDRRPRLTLIKQAKESVP